MLNVLVRNWWMVALRGLAAVIFGILAITWPGITLGVLIIFFGAFAFVDGVFDIAGAISGPSSERGWHLLQGASGIAIGIMVWAWPGLSALALLYLIAAWALVTGILEIVAAAGMGDFGRAWPLLLGGAISILFGIVLFANPGDGAIALVVTIGIFSIVLGSALIASGLSLSQLNERLTSRGARVSGASGQ